MIQMTCPFCKKEFPYNNGKLDRDISNIGQRITSINRELSEIKAMSPKAKKAKEGHRKVLVIELQRLNEKVSGLKAIRKACNQQVKSYEYQAFKDIVKERHGEEEYRKIIALVEEEIKAYQISGLMRHDYTRSPHKSNVTSVNKL